MLKTDCPRCTFTAAAPFLTEGKKTICARCGETFSVKDIYISAGTYTIYKKAVIDDTPGHVQLLRELQSEASELEQGHDKSVSKAEKAETIRIFVKMLKELLDSCRDKPRVSGGKTTVEYYVDEIPHSGKIRNISSTGICIAIAEKSHRIGPGRIIKMNIDDTALSEPLRLKGWVVWSTENGITGLKFVGLKKSSREALTNFIAIKISDKKMDDYATEGAAAGA